MSFRIRFTRKKVAAFCVESRHNAQPRTQPGKANFGYFRCNCPGLVCVIEDIDRKSAPVKFGSGLGPIRRVFRRAPEMPAAVPILFQSVHLQ